MKTYKTAESVCAGHPDKLCDYIADSVLDACMRKDKMSRVACEVMASKGRIIVAGEITCNGKINVRQTIKNALYEKGYNPSAFKIKAYIHKQSLDIAGGVNTSLESRNGDRSWFSDIGAGDQGTVYGYATDETREMLPLPLVLSHRICKALDKARKEQIIKDICPDGKAQVTVEYENGRPKRIQNITVSVQHKANKNIDTLSDEIISKILWPCFNDFPFDDTKFINRREDWLFVKVYTDEGISGTNTKNRNGFNEMIQDALGGKIDLIVTKSVSRFARNTVDSLVTVRKLKESGTEVFFEKENIYTFDSKGELLITIMSSLAQEESRSLSENVTWGQRKRFSDGKVQMNYTRFLGYEKGADGKPVINEKEAQTVRLIYRLFMEGKTPCGICRELEKLGILTVSGKQKWSASTVRSILTNERYKGDALLQKKFTVDFLTKKMKVNEGEVPQYYVEDSHPAIITKREFDIVQAEIARRKRLGSSYSGNDIFSSKIVCADCGGFYGSKLWHSKDKYKCTIYQCNNKFKNAEKCKTPNLTADEIRNAFIKAYNIVMADRTTVLEDCKIMIDTVCNSTKLNEEIDALTAELKVVSELVSECVNENAQKKQSQDAYTKKYNSLVRRYERAEKHLNKATAEREDKVNKEHELRLFFETLKNKPQLIDTWDENLWITLVEKIEVSHDKMCTVFFKNGVSVEVYL